MAYFWKYEETRNFVVLTVGLPLKLKSNYMHTINAHVVISPSTFVHLLKNNAFGKLEIIRVHDLKEYTIDKL